MSNSNSTKDWIALEIAASTELIDLAGDFCIEHGSNGVVLDDSQPDNVKITAYFPSGEWPAIRPDLDDFLIRWTETFPSSPPPKVTVSALKNENWAIAWKDHFRVMKIGRRITVTPPWLKPESDARVAIVIDPAEAFGTGTHETTQGCLVLLEDAIDEIKTHSTAFSLLDIGCGSGILAIAAVKLGADRVLAVDNDPVAVEAARRNALLNRVAGGLDIECLALRDLSFHADIVTANLDPQTLMANREILLTLFKRFLIVSGVPLNQWEQVRGLFQVREAKLVNEIARSEWGCGMFGKATAIR